MSVGLLIIAGFIGKLVYSTRLTADENAKNDVATIFGDPIIWESE